jgi:nucleotide-binding universal stress UspA family protein
VIVCGTDFGERAARAAEIAAGIAVLRKEKLFLAHALQLPAVVYFAGDPVFVSAPELFKPDRAAMEKDAEGLLASEAKGLSERTGAEVVPRLSIGPPDRVLLEVATDVKATLVVTGAQSRSGPARWVLGSTADRVARRSSSPVLVVRDESDGLLAWTKRKRPLRVGVGVNFEGSFPPVAALVQQLLAAGACELHWLHAFSFPAGSYYLREPVQPAMVEARAQLEPRTRKAMETLIREAKLPAGTLYLEEGKPATALTRLAEDEKLDLLVVGTHGRKGLERALLGSVALGVLHGAHCPVAVAPCL